MLLLRVLVRREQKLYQVKGDFKTVEGKRVRLSLGPPIAKDQLPAMMEVIRAAGADLGKLRQINGV